MDHSMHEHMHYSNNNSMMNMSHSPTMDPSMHDGMDHGNMDHGNMDHGNMDHGNMDMGHMGMMMYFHFSVNATILFKEWEVSSWQGMLGSCFGIFVMAALYEGLKVLREHLLRKANVMVKYNSVPSGNSAFNNDEVEINSPKSVKARMCNAFHYLQTFLHLVQVVLSYFLMLIFMTYNMWLCIAVALGAATGYFMFSWKRAIVVDINEHCH